MNMFTERQTKIFNLIANSCEIQTGRSIAVLIGVTSRTIRNEIKEINKVIMSNGAEITSKTGAGYELNVKDLNLYREFIDKNIDKSEALINETIIPSQPEDLTDYIIVKLLINTVSNKNMNQQELAEEVFISLSTLKNHLQQIKDRLKKFNLKIINTRCNGMKISGSEDKIRFCISEYIFNKKIGTSRKNEEFYYSIFPKNEIERIKDITFNALKRFDIKLTDNAFNNLVNHIQITLRRSSINKVVKYDEEKIKLLEDSYEFNIAKEIIEQVEKQLGVNIENEKYYITQHILASGKFLPQKISNKEYRMLTEIIQNILVKIKEKAMIDLEDDEILFNGLMLHLSYALLRIEFDMTIRNELLDYIKNNYAFAFELGIIASKEIEKKLNLIMNENEIGYLAIHFGAALERKGFNEKNNIKKIVIVCGSGIGTASLLKERVLNCFIGQVNVIKTTNLADFNEKLLNEADIVLSTIPIKQFESYKIIQVKPILCGDDISKINTSLYGNDEEKIMIDCFKIFKKELFKENVKLNSRYEVLKYITSLMKDKGYLDDLTIKSIYEREKMSSTELGSLVAIPHAIDNNMKEITIGVCILNKPIMWDKERVQVVLLLSVPKSKAYLWEVIFKRLYHVLIENFEVIKLITEYSYEDFIRRLMN